MENQNKYLIAGMGNEGKALGAIATTARDILGNPVEVRGWSRSASRTEPMIVAAQTYSERNPSFDYRDQMGLCIMEFDLKSRQRIFRPERYQNGLEDELQNTIYEHGDKVRIRNFLDLVTSDFELAMKGSSETSALPNYVIVCTTANAHSKIAERLANFIYNNQDLLYNHRGGLNLVFSPERFLGAWEAMVRFYAQLHVQSERDNLPEQELANLVECCNDKIIFAAAATSPVASRIDPEVKSLVHILGSKDWAGVAAIPESYTTLLARELRNVFPAYKAIEREPKGLESDNSEKDRDVRFTTAASTIAVMLHVAMTTWGFPLFPIPKMKYYVDLPKNPVIREAIQRIDDERVAALNAVFGIDAWCGRTLMSRLYENTNHNSFIEAIQENPAYAEIGCPELIDRNGKLTRYILEEVPFTAQPLAELQPDLMPFTLDSIQNANNIAFLLTGRRLDDLSAGRTPESLGLEGKSSSEIAHMLKNGFVSDELLAYHIDNIRKAH
ncbi:NAD/NADP octopine/nopaline dehydrogenase family protein [Candidatus Woesearchaeota archaeon]|nr:NAD/NADP octopine/nopaline dehydrogenase family protein [Candidatus Woesearchaeota archaeon]